MSWRGDCWSGWATRCWSPPRWSKQGSSFRTILPLRKCSLTDVVMPVESGPELARATHRRASGAQGDLHVEKVTRRKPSCIMGSSAPASPSCHKPFTAEQRSTARSARSWRRRAVRAGVRALVASALTAPDECSKERILPDLTQTKANG